MAAHRWIARLAVAALHIALFALLWLHRPPPLHQPAERRLTTVRLVQPRHPPPPPPTPATTAPRLAAPELPALAPPAFSTETPAPVTASPAPAAPPPLGDPAAEPPRTTLRLTLPPGYAASSAAARNPALSDPRSNTARRTLEDRIADAAAATGEWVSERTSDHRTLLRRGDTCVEVLRSRIADTDPFNGSVAPRTTPMFGKPYKCK